MNQEVVLFLIGQGLVILLAAGGAYAGISAKIARLRGEVETYGERRKESLDALIALTSQVQGISREVARHQTIIEDDLFPRRRPR